MPASMDRDPPAPMPLAVPKPLAASKAAADAYGKSFYQDYRETAQPQDPKLYYDPKWLYDQLVEGVGPAPVRLLRGSRLLARARRLRKCKTDAERERHRLPRRQEIPEEDFLSEPEVRALRRGHVGLPFETCCPSEQTLADKPLRIIAITHGWLTLDHPDPLGQQLVRFADLVEQERRWCPEGGGDLCRFLFTCGLSNGCCCFILPCAGQRCGDMANQFPSGEFAVFYECVQPRTPA